MAGLCIRARGRDLKGAIFDFASLPKVDFQDAKLQGASLDGAELWGASLAGAQLQGATLSHAALMGASLGVAQLQGASLDSAQLQGANLFHAELVGASLSGANLQGAWLLGAHLDGASMVGAQLQGATLQHAGLQATDLSGTFLWRTNQQLSLPAIFDVKGPKDVKLPDAPDMWRPNDKAYQQLRQTMEALPPGPWRDIALDHTARLDCANLDPTLASCGPPSSSIPPPAPPPEAAKWRTSLEAARVDGAAYDKMLAKALRHLICANDDIRYLLEFVRKHHTGLQSFRSMRRMEARRRKASALRLRHSQSLASLRQRPSQARVRSTIQRLGRTTKPLA